MSPVIDVITPSSTESAVTPHSHALKTCAEFASAAQHAARELAKVSQYLQADN
jgi:hypothetical protein